MKKCLLTWADRRVGQEALREPSCLWVQSVCHMILTTSYKRLKCRLLFSLSHHERPAVQFRPPSPPLPPRPRWGEASAWSGQTRQTSPAAAVAPTGEEAQKPLGARLWRAEHQGGPSLHLADVRRRPGEPAGELQHWNTGRPGEVREEPTALEVVGAASGSVNTSVFCRTGLMNRGRKPLREDLILPALLKPLCHSLFLHLFIVAVSFSRYWCRYAGKPDLCQAYGVKSSQYWKQLVGKLKKRQNACEGEKVLKAKTCKKAPSEAHMKLAQRSGEDERKGGKEGGKKKGAPTGKSSDGGKAERRKKKEEEEEEEKKRLEERTGFDEDGVVNDMDPAQSYCSEGWNSVCSFFVKFFEGWWETWSCLMERVHNLDPTHVYTSARQLIL